MQSETISPASSKSGLATLWDVIVAPGSAFAVLRDRPYAGWAFIVTVILGAIGAVLLVPANEHIAAATLATRMAHDPQFASMTPAQLERAKAFSVALQHWTWLITPIFVAIAMAIAALLMLVASAIGGGDGSFRRAFALAANVALINFGIGYLVYGIIASVRGGDAFNTQLDLFSSIPTLALLAPGAGVKLGTFLATITPWQLWSCALLGIGQQKVMRTNAAVAWIVAAILILIPAGLAGYFAV